MARAVTYLPGMGMYVKGKQAFAETPMNLALLASMRAKEITDAKTQQVTFDKTVTKVIDPGMARVSALMASYRNQIYSNSLHAADFEQERANLEHLILVKLHNQLMGEQQKWFHLDAMFNSLQLDKLVYRMTFKDNPASAQIVPRRAEFDTTKVNYQEIAFDLPKHVVSYDMPLEDPLRTMISPITPLQQVNDYSMSFLREKSALAALSDLKYHYTKSATGKAKFSALSAPTDTNALRISNPTTGASGSDFHSTFKTVNDIQFMQNDFFKTFDCKLTHFACSPRTAMEIAQNTFTDNNTINNVEMYRTDGGVRAFPGLSDTTMVISLMVPDNILYGISKPMNVMVKAEGPKITKTWEDENRWTTQTATADFFQYKCAHEDLTFNRRFGIIADIATIDIIP